MSHPKSVTEAGKDMLKDSAKAAKSGAKKVAHDVKAEAHNRVEATKESIADRTAHEAERLRAAAGEMKDGAPHTDAIGAAAAKVDAVANHLRHTPTSDLITDVADVARRHPVAAVTVAALAGFAIGRFIKSSNRTDYATTGPDLSLHHIPAPDDQVTS